MNDENGIIVGIDLGTSTSEVAVIEGGKPIVIPNKHGNLITPSVVYIGKSAKNKPAEIIVGETAQEYLLTRPERTFAEIKRNIGTDFVYEVDGRKYKPEEIQAMLLKYLAECASDYLGQKITRAVITVPAYFNDIQRRATEQAGILAGLSIERIINEPTAAAMDYGIGNMEAESKILVFDLGGGTLDVTVLELFAGVVDVKATAGNNLLGGKDFDEALMRHIYGHVNNLTSLARLKDEAVKCKIALTSEHEYNVIMPLFVTDEGENITIEKTVARTDFENVVSGLLQKMKAPVATALREANIGAEELDMVLLVGGATRMPCVGELVRDLLKKLPEQSIDPDLSVARGAAVQAGIIAGVFSPDEEIVLTDVCAFSLRADSGIRGVYDVRLVCNEMIKRNTTIPAETSIITRPFSDYQDTLTVKVYQGEYRDPGNNTYLGEVTIKNLPPKKSESNPIKLTMRYDLNGMLNVRAELLSTGKAAKTAINMTNAVTRNAGDLSVDDWRESPEAKKYRPLIRKAERLMDELLDGVDIRNKDYNSRVAHELDFLIETLKEMIILEKIEQADEIKEEIIEILEGEE